MGGPTTSSNTTVTPNQFDIQSADTAQLMNNFMMQNIQSGLSGTGQPFSDTDTNNILNQLRSNAGRYKIPQGSQQFQQIQQNLGEANTMPDAGMTQLAMSLYGASQPSSGPGMSTTQGNTNNPMGWYQYMPGIAKLFA
jgi:hypothetical protein